jgi:hypothetical protein
LKSDWMKFCVWFVLWGHQAQFRFLWVLFLWLTA